jgi:TRAP-type transport system large permease protein
MIGIITLAFFVLVFLAVPIAHALAISSVIAILSSGQIPLLLVVQQMFQPMQSFPLIAIPFFILAGTLMMAGKLGEQLIGFARMLVARYRGGATQVSVVGSAVFGAVSGSAVADAAALGGALIPWQVKEGYPPAYAAAVNSCSATIAILIPPSIPLILYSVVSGESIGALFMAGVVPGLLLTVGFCGTCNIIARLRHFPWHQVKLDWGEVRKAFVLASPALAMPVFILITLRFGIATPTEVSVMAVIYALLVGALIYRDLSWSWFYRSLVGAGVATGVVMLVIMASGVVGWIFTYEQIPELFARWATDTLQAKWAIILAMNVIMLVAGMFIDLPAAILLLGPIFVPLAKTIGLDPLQLGIMMVVNLAVGLYTPPVGTTLFICAAIAKQRIGAVFREMAPFYAVAMFVLLLLSYVPAFTIHF